MRPYLTMVNGTSMPAATLATPKRTMIRWVWTPRITRNLSLRSTTTPMSRPASWAAISRRKLGTATIPLSSVTAILPALRKRSRPANRRGSQLRTGWWMRMMRNSRHISRITSIWILLFSIICLLSGTPWLITAQRTCSRTPAIWFTGTSALTTITIPLWAMITRVVWLWLMATRTLILSAQRMCLTLLTPNCGASCVTCSPMR